jgi:hypothetical protein
MNNIPILLHSKEPLWVNIGKLVRVNAIENLMKHNHKNGY